MYVGAVATIEKDSYPSYVSCIVVSREWLIQTWPAAYEKLRC